MTERPSRSDLPKLFGEIRDGKWADETKFMGSIAIPFSLIRHGMKHIYCNKAMMDPLGKALRAIVERKISDQVKSWDGCFCIRNTRGEETPSVHSWGMAIDLNAATNALGTEGDISPELSACFTDQGFIWGKTFHRKDPMHFQFVTEK